MVDVRAWRNEQRLANGHLEKAFPTQLGEDDRIIWTAHKYSNPLNLTLFVSQQDLLLQLTLRLLQTES